MRGWLLASILGLFVVGLAVVDPSPSIGQARRDDVLSPRVQRATGLYISGPYLRLHGVEGILGMLRRSRMDTAVIDFKDGMGRVLFDSSIPELAASESGHIEDPRALVQALHDANVHVIGRIVCFSDRELALREPDRAIQDNRPRHEGRAWISWGTGGAWLNPWDRRNLDMIVRLADEVEAFGVDEIQLDYIRFPVDDGVHLASYPGERTDVTRAQHLHDLLARIDDTIAVPLGADVFGIQAFWEGDRSGLGQDLALWTDHVDIFSPMLYLNAMLAWERDRPHRARSLVQIGVSRLRERIGPRPIIRPFLQGFDNGLSEEEWSPQFIADQIRGARRGGADGYLFWNPGSMFGMVQRAAQGPARMLSPFPIPVTREQARLEVPTAQAAVARR
jgi:hypothetical protein